MTNLEWSSICFENKAAMGRLVAKLFPCTKKHKGFKAKQYIACYEAFFITGQFEIAKELIHNAQDELKRQWRKDNHKSIERARCPDCKRYSWFLFFYYEWYGPHCTCLRCGRKWSDGEWISLPSTRYARKESIEAAKKAWRKT
jgi:hypothetical protein